MTTHFTNNAQVPSVSAADYLPDQLIAGNQHVVTKTGVILSGTGVVVRGHVLGQITATGKYAIALSASSDGSQTPSAIAADTVDATSADQRIAIYLAGEFNANALTLGTGITLTTANLAALRDVNINIKTTGEVVAAADPTG